MCIEIWGKLLPVLLIVLVIVGAIRTPGYVTVNPKAGERFSESYRILTDKGHILIAPSFGSRFVIRCRKI